MSGNITSKGRARMTVFNTGPNALTMDFSAGPTLQAMSLAISAIMSRMSAPPIWCSSACSARGSARYEREVSLSNWLTHTPPALVAQHLNIDPQLMRQMAQQRPGHHAQILIRITMLKDQILCIAQALAPGISAFIPAVGANVRTTSYIPGSKASRSVGERLFEIRERALDRRRMSYRPPRSPTARTSSPWCRRGCGEASRQ